MAELTDDFWEVVNSGLPPVPTKDKNMLPVPEILRVIRYCLDPRVEKFDIASELADEIIKINSQPEIINWYGGVCFTAKKWDKAYKASIKMLDLHPSGAAYFNASKAAYKNGNPVEAEQYVIKAIELDPSNENFKMDKAVYVCSQGRFDEGFDILNSMDMSKLDNKDKKVLEFNKGWHTIRKGNFKEGMRLLNIGREIKVWGNNSRKHPCPKWDGVARPGKTILLGGEAGIGDEIISIRFAKKLHEMGMTVIASTVHKNKSLFERIPYISRVLTDKELDTFKEYDYWVASMDIIQVMGIDIDEVEAEPYLTADPKYVDKWSKIIPNTGKQRIGVRWAGNKLYELELYRTLPFDKLNNLTKYNADFYSLQKDAGVEDLTPGTSIVPLHDKLDSMEDLLGAIANLDLVITSCTSIAHIAGAMGKKTWVCTPLLCYWIWTIQKDKSPWYKDVTLYRQKEWNNWDLAFKKLELDLESFLAKA